MQLTLGLSCWRPATDWHCAVHAYGFIRVSGSGPFIVDASPFILKDEKNERTTSLAIQEHKSILDSEQERMNMTFESENNAKLPLSVTQLFLAAMALTLVSVDAQCRDPNPPEVQTAEQ